MKDLCPSVHGHSFRKLILMLVLSVSGQEHARYLALGPLSAWLRCLAAELALRVYQWPGEIGETAEYARSGRLAGQMHMVNQAILGASSSDGGSLVGTCQNCMHTTTASSCRIAFSQLIAGMHSDSPWQRLSPLP